MTRRTHTVGRDHPPLAAGSFDREREVREHAGDYVLSVAGLFPESLSGRRRFREMRLDLLVDYMKAGLFSPLNPKKIDSPGRQEQHSLRRTSPPAELGVCHIASSVEPSLWPSRREPAHGDLHRKEVPMPTPFLQREQDVVIRGACRTGGKSFTIRAAGKTPTRGVWASPEGRRVVPLQ